MALLWFQVLYVMLIVFIKGQVSGEIEKLSYGCGTMEGAKTVNEEISKLFQSVSIYEVTKPYFDTFVRVKYTNPMDECYPGKYNRFSDRFHLNIASMTTSAKRNEMTLNTAESLKRNVTEMAGTFQNAWKKVKRIAQLNQGIFEGLDIYFQDSLMQKSAEIGTKAKDDKQADPNIIGRVISQLSEEFENANALMEMMPRQILSDPGRFQNNIIYSQVHSALENTKHKKFLSQGTPAMRENIKVFSEISIKENIKKATRNLFDTYIRGFDTAKRFANVTEDTAERLKKAVDTADAVTIVTSCEESKKVSEELIDEAFQLLRSVRGEQEDHIKGHYRDIRYWFTQINKFEFMDQVRQALTLVSPIVPQNVHPELDELYSYVTSRADQNKMPKCEYKDGRYVNLYVLNKGWFEPYDKLSKMLSKVIKVSDCYRRVFQFVGQTVQSCSDGVGSLQDIYDQISPKIHIDESNCWSVSLFGRPSFDEIEQIVQKAAKKLGFNKDCVQNNQQDEPGDVRDIVIDDYSDESDNEKFSPTQRFMVCNLREKHSKSDEEINQKMDIRDLKKVKAVRCKNKKRSDSMYAKENQAQH